MDTEADVDSTALDKAVALAEYGTSEVLAEPEPKPRRRSRRPRQPADQSAATPQAEPAWGAEHEFTEAPTGGA
jgi:hypothetical protein